MLQKCDNAKKNIYTPGDRFILEEQHNDCSSHLFIEKEIIWHFLLR